MITLRGETDLELQVLEGWTLLNIINDQAPGSLKAECGGCLCCGTCIIKIDEGSERLVPPREDEVERIEDSGYDAREFRLACQILWRDEIGSLTITPVKED